MRVYNIKVNGKKYKVEVMGISEVEPVKVDTVKAPVAQAPAKEEPKKVESSSTGAGTPVLAPMQGTILSLNVKVGDTVSADTTVAILEAMKLENEIKAGTAGKVAEVKVSKGEQVNNKQVILVIE